DRGSCFSIDGKNLFGPGAEPSNQARCRCAQGSRHAIKPSQRLRYIESRSLGTTPCALMKRQEITAVITPGAQLSSSPTPKGATRLRKVHDLDCALVSPQQGGHKALYFRR